MNVKRRMALGGIVAALLLPGCSNPARIIVDPPPPTDEMTAWAEAYVEALNAGDIAKVTDLVSGSSTTTVEQHVRLRAGKAWAIMGTQESGVVPQSPVLKIQVRSAQTNVTQEWRPVFSWVQKTRTLTFRGDPTIGNA